MAFYLRIPYANKEIHFLIMVTPVEELQRHQPVQQLGAKCLN